MVRGYLIQYILYTVIKNEIRITFELILYKIFNFRQHKVYQRTTLLGKEIRIIFGLILCCLLIKIKIIHPSSKHEDEEKNNLPLRCYDKHSVTNGNVVCHLSRDILET